MDPETQRKMKVMQAFEDGKQIQMKGCLEGEQDWVDCMYPLWHWGTLDYRVKPERRALSINVFTLFNRPAWIKRVRDEVAGMVTVLDFNLNKVRVEGIGWLDLNRIKDTDEYQMSTDHKVWSPTHIVE